MGERLEIFAYRVADIQSFEKSLVSAVELLGGRITWNKEYDGLGMDCRTSYSQNVQTLYLSYLSGNEYKIAREVGSKLNVPWLSLRIGEGSMWEYTLYSADSRIHDFSVAPEYWNSDSKAIERLKGDSDLLARVWDVPRERIERYLVNWRMVVDEDEDTFEYTLKGKAYDSDKYSYGDIWQVMDFLHAMEGKSPVDEVEGARQHVVTLPSK